MRDVNDVLLAQQADEKTTELTVQALPPGYIKGFSLFTRDGQLISGPGIGNFRGTRVAQREEYIISGNDYVASSNVIPGIFYNVYVNAFLEYKIDSVAPEKDDEHFGYYHPTLVDYRYIGQFYLAPGNIYQNIISYNPLEYNSLTTNVINALLLSVNGFLQVGYSGDGTPDNPAEGDTFMLIDGDELTVVEYTAGEWRAKLQFGGQYNEVFQSGIACNTIRHIDKAPDITEPFPTDNFKLFTFDNTYEDHLGDDDWAIKTNLAFSSSWSKFGTYSLFTSSTVGLLVGPASGYTGDSFGFGYFIKMTMTGATTTVICRYYYDDGNTVYIRFDYASNEVRLYYEKGWTSIDYIAINVSDLGGWSNVSYLAATYNGDTDTLSLVVNNKIATVTGLPGTWDAGATVINVRTYNNFLSVLTMYVSELILSYEDYVPPETFVEHFNHNVPWEVARARADMVIHCNENGRIIFDDNHTEPSVGTLHMIPEADRPSTWVSAGNAATWTEVDFSAYVPYGTTALLLLAVTRMTGNNVYDYCLWQIRALGSSETVGEKTGRFGFHWNNMPTYLYGFDLSQVFRCSKEGKIQYQQYAGVTVGGYLYLNIQGYYI